MRGICGTGWLLVLVRLLARSLHSGRQPCRQLSLLGIEGGTPHQQPHVMSPAFRRVQGLHSWNLIIRHCRYRDLAKSVYGAASATGCTVGCPVTGCVA